MIQKSSKKKDTLPTIGWREWVGLPDLGTEFIKAKIDTGARSSALHAFKPKFFLRNEEEWVNFKIHPHQRCARGELSVEARIFEYRIVRSSSGAASKRPVIMTTLRLLGQEWLIELTLANRDEMGFRLLLGREAFRGRFLVDAGKSFYGIKPELSA